MRFSRAITTGITTVALGALGLSLAASPAHASYEETRPGVSSPNGLFIMHWQNGPERELMAQPFTQQETGHLTSASFKVNDIDTGYDFTSVAIHEVDDNGYPVATPIAGGSTTTLSYTDSGDASAFWATASFADRPLLDADTNYAFVIDPKTGSGENASFQFFANGGYKVYASAGGQWGDHGNTGHMIYTTTLSTLFAEPTEPTLNPDPTCSTESTITLPQVEGVVYTEQRSGTTVTVTATAAAGFELAPGSETEWQFDVSTDACSPGIGKPSPGTVVTPEAPTLVAAPVCGVESTVSLPTTTGVIYTESRTGDTITVTATAADGYQLEIGAPTEWILPLTSNACITDDGSTPGDTATNGTSPDGTVNDAAPLAATGQAPGLMFAGAAALLALGALTVFGGRIVRRRMQ